jgi:hypothetical protein
MVTKKKTLETLCREFIPIWDAFWESGVGEGPSYAELNDAFNAIKAQVDSKPK